jgi:hypothetical protein
MWKHEANDTGEGPSDIVLGKQGKDEDYEDFQERVFKELRSLYTWLNNGMNGTDDPEMISVCSEARDAIVKVYQY